MLVHSLPTLPASSGAADLRPVQPSLTGLELPEHAPVLPVARELHTETARLPHAAGAARRARRRYWSVRDLSRRIWLGRGYELLRELIRAGVLPATRSARSWWVDDAEVAGLEASFAVHAGKVRAFHGLEAWLRERCYAVGLTPTVEALARATHAMFIWRGTAYLPKRAWQAETNGEGETIYRHRGGATLPSGEGAAEAA